MADLTSSFPPNGGTDPLRLGFIRNTDGSFTRSELPPEFSQTSTISSYIDSPVVAKDITINQSNNLWIRVFIPREVFESSSPDKLPLVVYFIGGGFVFRQADLKLYEDYYKIITVDTRSVFVSVNYRIGPEHRLPAAYDDGMEVLGWIKNSPDDWLSKFADTSNTWIMGGSAGANLVYRVALRAASVVENLKPMTIKGLILIQPFFGGIKRTESEIRSKDDKDLPLWVSDIMWDLALPVGADRDHEYCNPMTGVTPDQFDKIKALGWKFLVTAQKGDPLSDRDIEFFQMLKEKGVEIVGKFQEGGSHGYNSPELYKVVVDFITSS